MNSEIEKLASMLDEAAEILHASGFVGWAEWFEKDANRIRSLDFFGIEHLLSAFGGMGSFNDVVLISRNEDDSPGHALYAKNEKLDELRTSIYNLANRLARDERT